MSDNIAYQEINSINIEKNTENGERQRAMTTHYNPEKILIRFKLCGFEIKITNCECFQLTFLIMFIIMVIYVFFFL